MIESIAAWVAPRSADIPAAALRAGREAIIDWFGATIPGMAERPARILISALTSAGHEGQSRIVGTSLTSDPRTAALINGVASHTLEVDDIYREGAYHPGCPTVAAALAIADARDAPGQAMLEGVIKGYEVGTRLAEAIQPDHYEFWHTTGTVGAVGAAVASSYCLGLSQEATSHAIANATTMAAGLQQAFRSDAMSKPLHAGHAAEAGVLAALGAEQGFTGAMDVLDGPLGFSAAMGGGRPLGDAFGDLGTAYNITRISRKPYPCCGHAFAPIDGALQMVESLGRVGLEDIESVVVRTYNAAISVAGISRPRTRFESKFSIPFTVLMALRDGAVDLSTFESSNFLDDQVQAACEKVRLVDDETMTDEFPSRRMASIELALADGRRESALRTTRKGDPDLPLTSTELRDKFISLVGDGTSGPPAEELYRGLMSLENHKVRDIASDYTKSQPRARG